MPTRMLEVARFCAINIVTSSYCKILKIMHLFQVGVLSSLSLRLGLLNRTVLNVPSLNVARCRGSSSRARLALLDLVRNL